MDRFRCLNYASFEGNLVLKAFRTIDGSNGEQHNDFRNQINEILQIFTKQNGVNLKIISIISYQVKRNFISGYNSILINEDWFLIEVQGNKKKQRSTQISLIFCDKHTISTREDRFILLLKWNQWGLCDRLTHRRNKRTEDNAY